MGSSSGTDSYALQASDGSALRKVVRLVLVAVLCAGVVGVAIIAALWPLRA